MPQTNVSPLPALSAKPVPTPWYRGVTGHVEPKSVHPARGHIGPQVHGGARSKGIVRYRNLRARSL